MRTLLVSAAVVLCAGAAYAAPMRGPEIVAALANIHPPRDAFDRGATLPPAQFTVEWPLHDGSVLHYGAQTSGFWTYEVATETLRVSASAVLGQRGRYDFATTLSKGKPFAATNGFGARLLVTPYESSSFGLQTADGEHLERQFLLKIAPEAGRGLVGNLRLRAVGRLLGPASCTDHVITGSSPNPVEIREHECGADAQIDELSLIRIDTGEVLQSW